MRLNTPIDLGRMIRDERKKKGWTQTELADKAGLLQKDISRIENHTAKVNLFVLLGICAVLNIQLLAERVESFDSSNSDLGF